jgi:hypothetical protein
MIRSAQSVASRTGTSRGRHGERVRDCIPSVRGSSHGLALRRALAGPRRICYGRLVLRRAQPGLSTCLGFSAAPTVCKRMGLAPVRRSDAWRRVTWGTERGLPPPAVDTRRAGATCVLCTCSVSTRFSDGWSRFRCERNGVVLSGEARVQRGERTACPPLKSRAPGRHGAQQPDDRSRDRLEPASSASSQVRRLSVRAAVIIPNRITEQGACGS